MEHIIQQIALELARKITERTLFDEIYDLDLMSSLALDTIREPFLIDKSLLGGVVYTLESA